MSDYRDQLAAMPSLALLALNDELNPSLCWNCNTQQGFYSSPCEKCGAINPNFDQDPFMPKNMAIAICDDLDEAIEKAEDWARVGRCAGTAGRICSGDSDAMTIIGVECRNCGSSHEFIDNRADEAIADMYKAIDERDGLAARLAATEENLERETALLTEARRQNADLMAIIDKRDEALGFIPLDKGMDMQDELRETKARLAAAERLLQEVRPMVQSYRRKHEKAFNAASRKLFTELAEKRAETMGKCDRILAAIGAADSAPADRKSDERLTVTVNGDSASGGE